MSATDETPLAVGDDDNHEEAAEHVAPAEDSMPVAEGQPDVPQTAKDLAAVDSERPTVPTAPGASTAGGATAGLDNKWARFDETAQNHDGGPNLKRKQPAANTRSAEGE